jgi:hypothetical protein
MVGTRGRGRRWAALLAAVALACAGAAAVAAAATKSRHAPRPTAADRAATASYVAADLALEQSLAAAVPERLAGERSVAAAIEAGCPGALAGLPSSEGDFQNSKQFGEMIRRQSQLGAITREIERALSPPAVPAELQALGVFTAAVKPLRWSAPGITQGVAAYIELVETSSKEERPPAHVCTDIAAWAASGYTTLSPATKAGEEKGIASLNIHVSQIVPPDSARLIPFESLTQRRQLTEVSAQRQKDQAALAAEGQLVSAVVHALGLKGEDAELEGPRQHAKSTAVLGSGRSAAGGRFTVTFERGQNNGECSINIQEGGSNNGIGLGSDCSLSVSGTPSVNCNEGLLTIQAVAPPTVKTVRLELSNGRSIASRAIALPASDGGPDAIYYQVLRGPSPIPVSLTELDAHGRTVAVKRLPRIVECTKHPLKFLPGGRRTLVHSRLPGGAAFTIAAQRYRFLGKVTLQLNAQVASEGTGSSATSVAFTHGTGGHPFLGPKGRSTFAPEFQSGCLPAAYTIVYGILKRPADIVLARSGSGLIALHKQAMPASLHAGGVLVWGAFVPPPTELVLRATPSKRILLSESLTERSTSQVEQCEGESEPGAASRP